MTNDSHDNRIEQDDGSPSDLATSRPPGGPGQVEQSPARGHRAQPRHKSVPDDRVAEQIESWLASRDDFDPERIQALVESGVVVLLGEVPDYDAKRRLEEFVLTLDGVYEVHDQLLVRSDAPFAGAAGLRTELPPGRHSNR